MFWSWIRSLVTSNSFVQQFTNHYYPHRPENSENAQSTPRMGSSSNHSKDSSREQSTANTNVSGGRGQPQTSNASSSGIARPNSRNASANSNPQTPTSAIGSGTGNKRKQPDENNSQQLKSRPMANQFDNGSAACLDNLRKLLNLNNDETDDDQRQQPDGFLLLGDRNRSGPTESFYQTWLAEYRSMQARGKQKLDQVKESLNQFKEVHKREQPDTSGCKRVQHPAKKAAAVPTAPIISLSNDGPVDQSDGSKLIKNRFIDQNLIEFTDQPRSVREQQAIREQVFEQIIGQISSPFTSNTVQNLIAESNQSDKPAAFDANVFPFVGLPNTKTNLSINSELMNQIKVSQAQSYHQQLNVCSGGTPVCSFRAQVKRSSYPSGLRTTALRIGPRLNRDKSRSRLVPFLWRCDEREREGRLFVVRSVRHCVCKGLIL